MNEEHRGILLAARIDYLIYNYSHAGIDARDVLSKEKYAEKIQSSFCIAYEIYAHIFYNDFYKLAFHIKCTYLEGACLFQKNNERT